MPNLLDKLNTLVRASVNSMIDDAGNKLSSARLPPERLGSDIDSEIAALRRKIDDALNIEDAMQAKIDSSDQQIAALDQQADDALKAGNEGTARLTVAQMQTLMQQNEMRRAALELHRRSTSHFIERVNTLESMVADAKNAKATPPDPIDQDAGNKSDSVTQPVSNALSNLSAMLRDARAR